MIFMVLFHMLCVLSEATEFPQGAILRAELAFPARHAAMNESVTWHALVQTNIKYSNYIKQK